MTTTSPPLPPLDYLSNSLTISPSIYLHVIIHLRNLALEQRMIAVEESIERAGVQLSQIVTAAKVMVCCILCSVFCCAINILVQLMGGGAVSKTFKESLRPNILATGSSPPRPAPCVPPPSPLPTLFVSVSPYISHIIICCHVHRCFLLYV